MRAWFTLAALSMSTFLYVTVETLPIGLLPQMAAGLGVHTSAVGLLVTAYGLIVVVTTIPLTRFTRHWPRRRLLGTVLLVATAGTAASAVAPNYATLLAGRISVALSQALFWAVVTPAAAALFSPGVRGRAVSLLYAAGSTAPLLGVPAGTWLGQHAGWRVPFLALAVLSLTVSATVLAVMPALPAGRSDTDRGSAPDAGRYRSVVATTIITVTGALMAFTVVAPFLTDVSGVGEDAMSAVLLARGVAGLAGAAIAGFLVTRYAWPTMVALIGGQALLLAAQYIWAGSPAVAVTTTALAGLTLSGLTTVLGARILEIAPGGTDTASAGTSTAFNVGITAGSLIGSHLLAHAHVRETALLAALVTAVALASVLAEPRLTTRRAPGTRSAAIALPMP